AKRQLRFMCVSLVKAMVWECRVVSSFAPRKHAGIARFATQRSFAASVMTTYSFAERKTTLPNAGPILRGDMQTRKRILGFLPAQTLTGASAAILSCRHSARGRRFHRMQTSPRLTGASQPWRSIMNRSLAALSVLVFGLLVPVFAADEKANPAVKKLPR